MLTFRKQERLCNQKTINHLFTTGKSFKTGQFLLNWDEVNLSQNIPLQILITVGKRKIPLASGRNKIRRLIREAIRKNKQGFVDFLKENHRQCAMAIIYVGSEKPEYAGVENKIILILRRLQNEYEKTIG